jgi:hypothetical protein
VSLLSSLCLADLGWCGHMGTAALKTLRMPDERCNCGALSLAGTATEWLAMGETVSVSAASTGQTPCTLRGRLSLPGISAGLARYMEASTPLGATTRYRHRGPMAVPSLPDIGLEDAHSDDASCTGFVTDGEKDGDCELREAAIQADCVTGKEHGEEGFAGKADPEATQRVETWGVAEGGPQPQRLPKRPRQGASIEVEAAATVVAVPKNEEVEEVAEEGGEFARRWPCAQILLAFLMCQAASAPSPPRSLPLLLIHSAQVTGSAGDAPILQETLRLRTLFLQRQGLIPPPTPLQNLKSHFA